MTQTVAPKTLVEEVYLRIRASILAGRLLPGQKLKLALLCEEHGASLSIVREALTRLSAEKLVRSQPQQGFTVTSLSPAGLRDLTFVRIQIESIALRRAMELGGVEWEAGVLAAHHVLANTPVHAGDDSKRLSEAYAAAHASFHFSLTAACDSPLLLDYQRTLYDASELYRRLSYLMTRERRGVRDKAGDHRRLMEATLARDADRVIRLLTTHYEATTRNLIDSGILDSEPLGDAA
ncbi:MAG: GntR family transcriptional regulator [Alphaproteobacteria bacterium]|nr:GntR family transcriptional regulator [Alphaproteobacteria bacterium]